MLTLILSLVAIAVVWSAFLIYDGVRRECVAEDLERQMDIEHLLEQTYERLNRDKNVPQ